MPTIDSDDLEATGYFLPEDSQLRLKKLREYVGFLANLARPRSSDEAQEWTAEIRAGEVAICLELLEEQIGQVLDEVSWPARRGNRAAARGGDTERLGPVRGRRNGVREEPAAYRALPARLLMGSTSRVVRQLPTCQQRGSHLCFYRQVSPAG